MQTLTGTNLVLAALILYRVIRSQLTPHTVKFKLEFFLILMVVGLASVGDAVSQHHLTLTTGPAASFAALSLVGAVGFAGLRAWSTRLWVNDQGLVLRQGTWVTLVWWVLGIGTHVILEHLWTGGAATLLLYLGVTLFVQRGCVWWRAQQAFPQELMANARVQRQPQKSRRH